MPVIDSPRIEGSGLVWGCDFRNRMLVQSQGGIIVGSTIGNGISPTAASSRVTFPGTESVGANATQLTIILRFRTSANAVGSARRILAKVPAALNNNQFFVQQNSTGTLNFTIANAAGDFSQSVSTNAALALATEYHVALPYNGGLVAASRAAIYANAALPAQTVNGTIPAAMRVCPSPLTVFNFNGEATNAPPVDFILRSARVFNRALSLAEIQDDYANQTFSEIYT